MTVFDNSPLAHKPGLIYEALAKAQSEFEPVKKNREGQIGTRTYPYADLASILEAVRPALNKHGLFLMQHVVNGNLVTEIRHASGEGIIGAVPLQADGDVTPQQFGSALTYGRRQGLSALLGIAAEEDDDGTQATEAKQESHPKGASEKQRNFVVALLASKLGVLADGVDNYLKLQKLPGLASLSVGQAGALIDKLTAHKGASPAEPYGEAAKRAKYTVRIAEYAVRLRELGTVVLEQREGLTVLVHPSLLASLGMPGERALDEITLEELTDLGTLLADKLEVPA